MTEQSRETAMVHYECNVCGITATVVSTPSALLAWCDHMETHAWKKGYDVWTWTVLHLDLD
jgi:hypothetical protein